jgi:ribosomal protein L11 methyltransferase
MTSAKARSTATSVAVLETAEQPARRIAGLFAESFQAEDLAASLVDIGRGRWRVEIHFGSPPDAAAVRALAAAAAGQAVAKALRFEQVVAKDWVAESLAGLKPVSAGRFIVHGAHDRAAIPFNRIGIEIEAALAFGTGHHGTTRGCLLALDRLCKLLNARRPVHRHPEVRAKGAPRRRSARAVALRGSLRSHLRVTEKSLRILDLGTGSGVLAIAAARAMRQRVLATDVDAVAVRAAHANARINRAAPFVRVMKADGVTARALRERAPYDLIFANILLAPLQRFAATLMKFTARGGHVVLSGLLRSQANAALAAYPRLVLERRIDVDGWSTLVLGRKTRPEPSVARRLPGKSFVGT